MPLDLLIKGLVIGFSIAAPVGPIGVLCIRRTLADGWVSGLVSGLGAASADACYGLVAALGLTFISTFLVDQRAVLQLLGGIFLCFLGAKAFSSKPADTVAGAGKPGTRGLVSDFLSTFVLTLTNPLTVLSFAAIFVALGLGEPAGNYSGGPVLVIGVFVGSASWWLVLSGAVSIVGRRISHSGLLWINRLSGTIIVAFGLVALYGGVASLFNRL